MVDHIKSYFTKKYFASGFDVFLLGMTMSVCGTCFAWRYAMQTHFYEYLTDMIIVTVMYICLVLCVAEMMSALPFSGGIYGLARVALSPYIGFLVGILEVFKNIFHISCCVEPLGLYVANVLHDDTINQPLYWLVILGSVAIISIIGGRFFWNFNRILGLACLAFTIMYLCTPMMNRADFKLYANTNYFFQPVHNFEIHNMFRLSPLAIWFYIGIELIPFTCKDVKNPTKIIPYTMMTILVVLILFTFGVYTAACSQFPGAFRLFYFDLPLMFGYADMLGITYENACWFSIICIYASVFAFMFGCGRQIASLSESGLLPPFLKWKTMYSETPYMSIITTAVLCYLTMISVRYGMNNLVNTIYYICLLGALFSYVSVFVTYIQFKRKYMTLKREFTNPFGIYAAVLGIIISLLLTCVLCLANNAQFFPAPITIVIVLVVASIYYFSFASKKQYYSEEEQKAFLITYVINSNSQGRKRNKRKGGNENILLGNFASFFSLSSRSLNPNSARSDNSKSGIIIKKVPTQKDISLSSVIHNREVSNDLGDMNSIDLNELPSLDILNHMKDESGNKSNDNIALWKVKSSVIVPVNEIVDNKDLEANVSTS